jgi:hypothetical protein
MGMVVVAFFAAAADCTPATTIRSTLSLDPSKLAQLMSERLDEHRHTRSSTWIQETDAKDFPCLLRAGGQAKRKEHSTKQMTLSFLLLHIASYLMPIFI